MFLLDTNVISELRKAKWGRADHNVVAWAQSIPAENLFTSVMVIQELETGVLLAARRDPAQGVALRTWLDDQIVPSFSERILPIDMVIAQRSATLHAPDPRPIQDGLIAATALVHGMTVATRKVTDFASMGVSLVNPWDYAP
jgi:predicted nucleic acid-binding protein